MYEIILKIAGTIVGVTVVWWVVLSILASVERERIERDRDRIEMERLGISHDRRRRP